MLLTASATGTPGFHPAVGSEPAKYRPDGVLACEVVAGTLVVSYANDDLKQLLGIANRPVCGLSLIELLDAHLDDSVAAVLCDAVTTQQRFAIQLERGDLPLTFTLRPGPVGGIWRGTLRPIAPDVVRIQAAALQIAPTLIPANPPSVEHAPFPAIVFDLTYELAREDYRIEHVSESCRSLLGLTPAELVRSGFFPSLARPQDLERLLGALTLAAHGRRRFEHEFALQEPTRRFAWARVVADPFPTGLDEVRYSGIIVDATGPRAAYEHLSEVLDADRAQLRASAAELRISRARVKCLEAEVSEVSHREQERIGHDLHDGLGQELVGLSLLFKALEDDLRVVPGNFANRAEDLRDILDRCATTTRTLAQTLSPVHLESDGLAVGLWHLVLSFETLYDLKVKFTCADGLPTLDEAAGANVYRIVQEALSNAVKHARATAVAVRVETRPGEMLLEIEDDGVGLGPSGIDAPGMGMKIMRYRAGVLGARIEFTDGLTGGTLVRCAMKMGDRRIAGVET